MGFAVSGRVRKPRVHVGAGRNILDACAGPHTGSETPDQYVTASIDATPALYGSGFRPGKASDIIPGGRCHGVN